MTDTPTPSIEDVKELLTSGEAIRADSWTVCQHALATITALQSELAKLKAKADEETAWDEAVKAAGGLDLFDALAGQWVAREPIRRMIRACTSVFAKWANDDLMSRYHEAVENIAREAYVEGAAAGALATLKDSPNTAKVG